MNVTVLSELLVHPNRSIRDLFSIILNHSAATGWYEASVEDLGIDISLHERTVYRLVKELEDMGAIVVERTGGGRGIFNRYRTTVNDDTMSIKSDTVSTKSDMVVNETVTSDEYNGDISVVNSDTHDISRTPACTRLVSGVTSSSGTNVTNTNQKSFTSPRPRETDRPPDDFQPSHQTMRWAKDVLMFSEGRLSLEREKFIDYYQENQNKRSADWDATFRQWLRRSSEWNPSPDRPLTMEEARKLPPNSPLRAKYGLRVIIP